MIGPRDVADALLFAGLACVAMLAHLAGLALEQCPGCARCWRWGRRA